MLIRKDQKRTGLRSEYPLFHARPANQPLRRFSLTALFSRRYKGSVTYPGRPFTLASGIALLLAGFSTTTTAADRYWDPLNDDSYLSTGYTTHAAATVVWNATNLAFDASPVDPTNAVWAPGDDAFISLTPSGTPVVAPATNWFIRIGTAAPTVHNVTYDS